MALLAIFAVTWQAIAHERAIRVGAELVARAIHGTLVRICSEKKQHVR